MTGTAVTTTKTGDLVDRLGEKLSVSRGELLDALNNLAFDRSASDGEKAAFLVVCNEYGLNPMTREIYQMKTKAGMTPVVGVDGWIRLINDHPMMNGVEFDMVKKENGDPEDRKSVV